MFFLATVNMGDHKNIVFQHVLQQNKIRSNDDEGYTIIVRNLYGDCNVLCSFCYNIFSPLYSGCVFMSFGLAINIHIFDRVQLLLKCFMHVNALLCSKPYM